MRAGALFLLWLAALCVEAAVQLTGRPVAQVLDEAIRAGVKIIYSSERVPPDLQVSAEPQETELFARLLEVLQPHGLTLKSVTGDVWVVVPATDEMSGVAEASAISQATVADDTGAKEVTVTGSRYTLVAPPAGASLNLGAGEIQTQPALLDDALRAVRRFPGTAATPYSSRTHVRGGGTAENLVVLDGVPLMEPYRLQGLPADFSLIDPAIVSQADFYSGVFPPEYGGRMASVTHLRTRHAAQPFGGRLALSFVNASALLEGTLPRDGDWLIAARRGTLDLMTRALEPDAGRPALLDLFASARLRTAAGSMLSFGALSADDDVSINELDGSESSTAESGRTQLWLNFENEWRGARLVTRLTSSSSNLERAGLLRKEDLLSGELKDNRSVRASTLSQDWSLPLPSLTLRGGWSFEDMDVDYDYRKIAHFAAQVVDRLDLPSLPNFAIRIDSGARSVTAYAAAGWSATDDLALDLGMRWQQMAYETNQGVARVDPRLSLLYRFGPRFRGRLAWGRLTQFETGAELPVERGLARYDDPARASLWVLGFDYEWATDRLLRVELYDKRIDAPHARLESLLDPIVLVPELRPDQILIAPESASATGIDLHLSGRLNERWRGWLSYSGSRALDEFTFGSVSRSWDQRHSVSAGLTTDRWGWSWAAVLTGHSGWPTTSIEVSPSGEVVVGPRNGARLPWYGTLDLKAQRRFELPHGALRFSAELTNATARGNVCCSSLNFERQPDGGVTAKVERKTWLPLVPFLSAAWEF